VSRISSWWLGLGRRSKIIVTAVVVVLAFGAIGAAADEPNPGGAASAMPTSAPSGDASLTPGVSARPVGISAVAPASGTTVTVAVVTVTGHAAPGAEVVRDIPLAQDQHVIAAGDGTWSMSVELKPGDNELVFRLGGDRSTEVRISLTYLAPTAAPPTAAPATATPLPTRTPVAPPPTGTPPVPTRGVH
jgi:hypothetical protein